VIEENGEKRLAAPTGDPKLIGTRARRRKLNIVNAL
jgi:hypothetical protein